MDQERAKRRKCGPRVKTGCITCRIRRIKCDEAKPNCQRCVLTGRKCDGYAPPPPQKDNTGQGQRLQIHPNDSGMEVMKSPGRMMTAPADAVDSQRNRQIFHFYCVQSALDLSVYLNDHFWHDMILQYSHVHPVVRQAVLAFGSAHMYALSCTKNSVADSPVGAFEQAQQYDCAIRSLREYIESDSRPDPHVILICCALFFSCENARGNREAAWQHLENGLHILSSVEGIKSQKLLKSEAEVSNELDHVASKNGSKLKAKTERVDIDDELVFVFSRLDVQVTLCKETRRPVLNLAELSKTTMSDTMASATTFSTITDAQRSLDYIHNRLARFLHTAASSQPQTPIASTPEPDWVENERVELNKICTSWEAGMHSFIKSQQPAIKQNLQSKQAPGPNTSPEWRLALQIQLLTLHHRCWWMLFRSYHNPSVYIMSPNPRAAEILDICEFLGFALPVRPSVSFLAAETDVAWKMVSEIGVIAPLFVLATKCTDATIRTRAIAQLTALRKYGNGLYHEKFLDQITRIARQVREAGDHTASILSTIGDIGEDTHFDLAQRTVISPCSDFGLVRECSSHGVVPLPLSSNMPIDEDPGGLLGWSNPVSRFSD